MVHRPRTFEIPSSVIKKERQEYKTYTWWLARRWRLLNWLDGNADTQTDLDLFLRIIISWPAGNVSSSLSLSVTDPPVLSLLPLPRLHFSATTVVDKVEVADEEGVTLADEPLVSATPRKRDTNFISRHNILVRILGVTVWRWFPLCFRVSDRLPVFRLLQTFIVFFLRFSHG